MGRRIAKDLGKLAREDADTSLQPIVYCIDDMGEGKAFYIRSNSWFRGPDAVLKLGRLPYFLKMRYSDLFFQTHGKTAEWGPSEAELMAEGV